MNSLTSINNLPSDCLREIFYHADNSSIPRVCKLWQRVFQELYFPILNEYRKDPTLKCYMPAIEEPVTRDQAPDLVRKLYSNIRKTLMLDSNSYKKALEGYPHPEKRFDTMLQILKDMNLYLLFSRNHNLVRQYQQETEQKFDNESRMFTYGIKNLVEQAERIRAWLKEASLDKMTDLTLLPPETYGAKLMNALPEEIKYFGNLKGLSLAHNQLSDLSPEIGKLEKLTSLSLPVNKLSRLPKEIGKLKSLTSLNINSNNLFKLPKAIGKLANLKTLKLSYNHRLSALPTTMGELKQLQSLELGTNQFKSFPIEITELLNLETLDLSDNQLESLPPEIGKLTKLKCLQLSGNKIKSLPVEIGKLVNLKELLLDDNHLATLPKEIGQLGNLERLSIKKNPIASLPREIEQLRRRPQRFFLSQ